MADDPYAYLSGFSAHPDRAGDTSNLNPAFANSLANAIRQAREAGLPVGLMSGYRSDTTTGSAYDAGGNSSHGYGLASDISGLDGPNGKITQAWAQIAQANGLHNPYGIGNEKEFNHWQLPPQPLEQTPQLLDSLKEARASGNFQNVWNAYNGANGTGPAITNTSAATQTAPGTTITSRGVGTPPGTPTPNTPVNDFYHTAMMHESGGKNIPNAAGGAASGYYQFMPATYAGVRAAHPELNLPANLSDANQDQQTAAYHEFTKGNVEALQSANLPVNDRNAFMASFLGGGGATKFLGAMAQNPDAAAASLFPKEAQANPTVFYANGQPRSLNQVFALETGKFGTGNTTGFGPGAGEAPGPIDPSIIARGGYSPPIPTTPGTTINSNPMASLGGKIGDLAGNLQKDLGKSDEAQKPPDIKPDIPPAPGARNVSPLLGGSAGIGQGQVSPVYAQRVAALNQPMTWGGGPPGQMYGAGYGPQNQPVYGTSLMSQLQMLSDPTWMNQMAGGSYG